MESSENNAEINIDPLLQALNKAGISRMSTEGVVQVPVSSLNQIVKAAKTSGVAAEIVGTESGALKIKLLKDFVKPSLVDLRPDLFSPSGEKDDIEFLVGSGALEDAAGPRRS
ncbi:MAG: hypothetical protein EOP04_18015 [Proteobacteria bacterium]|nr:MAG: hypothetical protein EOP04_18015 [Pseudomonadota bacterium]